MKGGVIPGTVDLVILRAVSEGPVHGFGISRSLSDRSGGVVELQDAALYQALHRLTRQGLLEAEWGISETNRRAKFYRLTAAGQKQLSREESHFRRYVEGVMRILAPENVGA
jgi:transcriptional regulator